MEYESMEQNRRGNEYGTFYPNREGSHSSSWKTKKLCGVIALLVTFCACLSSLSYYRIGSSSIHNSPYLLSNRYFSSFYFQSSSSKHENMFLSIPDGKHISESVQYYASKPHSAGTKADYETALYTKRKFEEYGLEDVDMIQYTPLLSKPISRHVSLVEPIQYNLRLDEDEIPGDNCTYHNNSMLPPFIAYSASGNITSSIIYVNYGTLEDFQYLTETLNVTLKNKIALCKYGKNFRGIKIALAQQYGMAGILIYSDPQDDGFVQGKVYPNGIWRPEESVQRGSGTFLSFAPGDPLTPGIASKLDTVRLSIEDTVSLPKIPAQPLSYGQAIYILKTLGGERAPGHWQGGLNITYNIGNDDATIVNINLEIDNYISPIWNVVGKIHGMVEEDRHVIIGNHRDAWVCGAVDPISGTASMLEILRGFHSLKENGWKPYRTLVFASWDGEEYGLIGSSEYAEEYKRELFNKAVAYINVDNLSGNFFIASGSPVLHDILVHISKYIPYNRHNASSVDTATSLYDKWRNQSLFKDEDEVRVGVLGSGSDYTPFYQHIGVISANLGFTQKRTYGTYHSSMDSYPYLSHFGDPNFTAEITMAKYWGLLTLQLANSEILPYNYTTYGDKLRKYTENYKKKIPKFKWKKLIKSIDKFIKETEKFYNSAKSRKTDRQCINDILAFGEHKFTLSSLTTDNEENGLAHRPWFKHIIYGPGLYLGYGAVVFPGLDDAILLNDTSDEIQVQIDLITECVYNATEFFKKEC